MRPLVTLMTCSLLLGGIMAWQPARADGPFRASLHLGATEVDRVIRSSGPWWSSVDERNTALGVSLGYDYSSNLGFRVMYERGNDYATVNVCPPNASCPTVAIQEEMDFSAWHFVALPRFALNRDWSVYGLAGAMSWNLDRDRILPKDSGTEFTYGAGVSWRMSSRLELGFEYQASGIDYDVYRFNVGTRF